MVCVHLKDGNTLRLNPSLDNDLCFLDNIKNSKNIRRIAIIDNNGKRVDLPINKNGSFIIWLERLKHKNNIKGECVYMKNSNFLLRATLYYSDLRVVLDIDTTGGFILGKGKI